MISFRTWANEAAHDDEGEISRCVITLRKGCDLDATAEYDPDQHGALELLIADLQRDVDGGWGFNGCFVYRYTIANLEQSERAALRELKALAGRSGERWDQIGRGQWKVRGAAVGAWMDWREVQTR